MISAEADESVTTLPGITSGGGGSKSAIAKDDSAATPKKGGKPVIPGKTGRQSGKQFRREEHPPANVNPYAPRAESGIPGCDGRGRESLGGRRKV